MKKFLLFVSLLAGVLTSCGGDSDGEAVNLNPGATGCSSSISGFNVQQDADQLDFTINATSGAIYYEVSLSPTNGNFGPDSGNIYPLDIETNSISLVDNSVGTNDYVVFVRAVCSDNTRGLWVGPKLLSINDYCETPINLNVTPYAFTWSFPGNVSSPSNYQVQYGPQGFTVGTGTTANVNIAAYGDAIMQAGQSYDFYVRAFCSNGLGYGNWEGPYTYFAEENSNLCQTPLNIVAHVQDTSDPTEKYVHFSWNGNGESTFQYTLVYNNHAPEGGNIETTSFFNETGTYSLSVGDDYDFYVRSVCNDGDTSVWVKKDLDF